jgi:hypothetical protein
MSSAKKSALDTLHAKFVKELTEQLKGTTDENGNRAPPTAALLAVISATLYRSGVKPTNDSPSMAQLAKVAQALPFKPSDENKETLN